MCAPRYLNKFIFSKNLKKFKTKQQTQNGKSDMLNAPFLWSTDCQCPINELYCCTQ